MLGVKIWFGEFKGREYTRQPCYCEANGLGWGRAGGGEREPGRAGIAEAQIAAGLGRALRGIRPRAALSWPQPPRSPLVQPSTAGRRAPGPGSVLGSYSPQVAQVKKL